MHIHITYSHLNEALKMPEDLEYDDTTMEAFFQKCSLETGLPKEEPTEVLSQEFGSGVARSLPPDWFEASKVPEERGSSDMSKKDH